MSLIEQLFSLEGKVALVTGGTSGIGLMIARGLIGAGARVYIVARDAERCAAVTAELSAIGTCHAMPGDLGSVDGIAQVAQAFGQAEEKIDILVNNAGIMEQKPIGEYGEDLWDRALDLNLKAAFFLTQELLPLLRRGASSADPARVINIGSGHGLRVSNFDHFGYSASKAGIHHLTRVLALKLAPDDINVNAIAPGLFATLQTADFSDDLVDRIVSVIPRRRFGEESDMIGAALYLCSRAGAYATGVILPIDGGRGIS